MTKERALKVLETRLVMIDTDPQLREALDALRPVKRVAKPKDRWAALRRLCDRPVFYGVKPLDYRGHPYYPTRETEVAKIQRERYLATFADPEAQAKRLDSLPVYAEFTYDPPKAVAKSDESLRVYLAAFLAEPEAIAA